MRQYDDRVGYVSALAYSPRLGKNIGYAMVPTELAGLGTSLSVQSPLGELEAIVVRKPFVDPKKDIPKL